MRYEHTETKELWNDNQASTKHISNFYLLSHQEKIKVGWTLVEEPVVAPAIDVSKKIVDAKTLASNKIYATYPLYKQVNAISGVYGESYLQTMRDYIKQIIDVVDAYEIAVQQNPNLEIEL